MSYENVIWKQSRPGTSGNKSIPACAGEPRYLLDKVTLLQVYPRVCGGTVYWGKLIQPSGSLSPRVRGNRSSYDVALGRVESIPACAVEPAQIPPGYEREQDPVA